MIDAQTRGGKAAAAKNRRAPTGEFVKSPTADDVQRKSLKLDQPKPADYFFPVEPSERLKAVRPFPRISGRRGQLDHAIRHLEGIAEGQGITIHRFDTTSGEIGWFDPNNRTINLHGDIHEDPALYAFSLAHELGHSFDPRFQKLGEDYNQWLHHGAYEVVAEAAAIRSLKSFGLHLENADDFLTHHNKYGLRNKAWKTGIKNGLFDRYQSCSIPLLKPSDDPKLTAARDRDYLKARKRALRQAIYIRRTRDKRGRKSSSAPRRSRRGIFGRRRGGRGRRTESQPEKKGLEAPVDLYNT